jgi:hypothetical protein
MFLLQHSVLRGDHPPLKLYLHEIFYFHFSIKNNLRVPWFLLQITFKHKFELSEILKFKGHSVDHKNTRKEFLGQAKTKKHSFLVSLGPSCTSTLTNCILKKCPSKSCEENKSVPNIRNYWGTFAKYTESICIYTENTWNKSVHMLGICRGNLYIYGRIHKIKVNFWMEFAVHIRWIHGMNLFVYWENAE